MAVMNINPTRMQLTKLKKRLSTAVRGHKLLKDKRDELMKHFLEMVKENKNLREEIEDSINKANIHFSLAGSVMKKEILDVALMAPKQEISVNQSSENIMSVEIPKVDITTRTSDEGDIFSYGFGSTSFELDEAVEKMNELLPKLLKLAQIEKATILMSIEIEKTRRRVNALEHIMIPNYKDTVKYISMKLEENERASRTRLMKVKDMMLEQAHGYAEKY